MKKNLFIAICASMFLSACTKENNSNTFNSNEKLSSATSLATISQPNSKGIQIKGKASDVGIGADGSVFVIGIDSVSPTGGFSISKLIADSLSKLPFSAGTRIAVSPSGIPWVINKSHLIYKYNGYYWTPMPGTGNDIGIGADGSVYIIGTDSVSATGGNSISKWNGTNWTKLANCAGMKIAVAPDGTPWVVAKSNIVYRKTSGELWTPINGVSANDIGIGADGSVYVTGKDTKTNNPAIYKYVKNSWSIVSGVSGLSIAVSPKGNPYWTDRLNNLYKLNK